MKRRNFFKSLVVAALAPFAVTKALAKAPGKVLKMTIAYPMEYDIGREYPAQCWVHVDGDNPVVKYGSSPGWYCTGLDGAIPFQIPLDPKFYNDISFSPWPIMVAELPCFE